MSCKPSSYSTNLGDGSKWENPNFNTFGTNGVFAFKFPTKFNNYNVQTDKDKLVSTCFAFKLINSTLVIIDKCLLTDINIFINNIVLVTVCSQMSYVFKYIYLMTFFSMSFWN